MDKETASIIFHIALALTMFGFMAMLLADTMRIMQDKRENYKRSIIAACILVLMVIIRKSFFE
jgi:hypothetical protein